MADIAAQLRLPAQSPVPVVLETAGEDKTRATAIPRHSSHLLISTPVHRVHHTPRKTKDDHNYEQQNRRI